MIVDPDFPDHWKTRMLVDLLGGDESAPVYLLRLWAHCQNRRTASFAGLPSAAVKALCRFPGDAAAFEEALTTSGFIRRDGALLIVCGWEEYNAGMIANWENGKKGGRPAKKKPDENPSKTHGLSTGNPSETHGEPRGEERIGEDKRERDNADAGTRRPTLAQAKAAAPQIGVTPEMADEWWNAREASDWWKGTAGGGRTPVGSNWQADLKTYASRMGSSQRPATTGEQKLKKLAWE